MFNNVEDIRKAFINAGWSKDTKFTELTLEEAKKQGLYFAIDEITKGKKYFKMNVTGNIYDSSGKVVFYNISVNKG